MKNSELAFEDRAFMALLLAVTLLFLWLLTPFFGAILWAVVLTIIFYPLQRRLLTAGRKPTSAALFTMMLSVVAVVVPLMLIMLMLATEAAAIYQQVNNGEFQPQQWVDALRQQVPYVNTLAERFNIDLANIKAQFTEAVLTASRFLATQAFSIGQEYVRFTLNFFIMLYLVFFFLRDGERLKDLMIRALPFGDQREAHLFQKFAEVARATIKGNLVVAIVQGTLGGLIFWVLGIKAAFLWGVVMTVLSLLPAVGSALVWGPAAAYLLLTGATWQGIVLIAFGVLVIGLVDNVLRPILVGRETKLPDYMVLLSTLAGIVLFGLNGFVIGPIIATLFVALWQIFMEDINQSEQPVPPS